MARPIRAEDGTVVDVGDALADLRKVLDATIRDHDLKLVWRRSLDAIEQKRWLEARAYTITYMCACLKTFGYRLVLQREEV